MFEVHKRKGQEGGGQWSWDPERLALRNPKFGEFRVGDVCDPNSGKVIYQQPVITEVRGEVLVVVNDKGEIAFVMAERHVPISLATVERLWAEKPKEVPDYFAVPANSRGMVVYELPRGFSAKPLAEGAEETRYKMCQPGYCLGHANPNTTFWATSPLVYVVRALPEAADTPPDPNESIVRVVWQNGGSALALAGEELSIDCFTARALLRFRRWAENPVRDLLDHAVAEEDVRLFQEVRAAMR